METQIVNLLRQLFVDPSNSVISIYKQCNKFSDPRVDNWFLMSSPFPALFIVMVYFTAVRFGPILMKERQPFKLKWVLITYNFGVTILNGWMAFEIAIAIWWYFFSKLIELMDTLFFILRKKQSQLTFLHVYHHSTMFIFWWVGAKFVPGGSALTGAMVNCFVHIVMYSYYGLAAFGPKISQYLWWKKYLTILQLIQFTTGVVLGMNAIITNCQFTRWMQYVFVAYAFSFLLLFGNFYQKAYVHKEKVFHLQQ